MIVSFSTATLPHELYLFFLDPNWFSCSNENFSRYLIKCFSSLPITLFPTTTILTTKTIKTVIEQNESQKLFIHAVRHVAKGTTPQKDVMFEPMQQTSHCPGRANRRDRVDITNRTHRTVWLLVSRPKSKILTRNASSSLQNCEWQTGDHQKKTPPIPDVVWQQLLEISVESSS